MPNLTRRIGRSSLSKESNVMKRLLLGSLLALGSLTGLLCLAGCEEDIAGPTGVDEPFSLYGVFNPRLTTQTMLVAPVEDLLVPESGDALDAVVTSTDLGSGKTWAWRDSVAANVTGQLDHIYRADFTPGYGSRHRMEVVRSDGTKSVVNVEVPVEVRIEDKDAGTRDLTATVTGVSDFSLIRFDVTYSVRYYNSFNPDPYALCDTPLKHYTFSYKNKETAIENGWQVDIDLNILYETMRSYYHDDTGIEFRLHPAFEGLALMSLGLFFTVGSSDWDPPGGDLSDERVLIRPGTLSNVENGYGFVGGGYNEEATLYPSSRAVEDTPFFDFIQQRGGDYCLGTNAASEG